MTNSDNTGSVAGITTSVMQYLKLLMDDTRLNVAEKLTRLLSAVALCSILLVIAIVAMVFLSLAIGYGLADVLTPVWSFVIMASFYVVIFAVLILFRRVLLINPIARFISRLLLDAPENPSRSHEHSSIS